MRPQHFITALLFFLLTTCSLTAQDSWKTKYQPESDDWKSVDQHFIFNSGAEPETLDPHQITAADAFRLVGAMFEGLMEADPETLKPQPACAERYSVSGDGLEYCFKLRKNLKWSNGSPLTATDFLQSFKRALSPGTAAAYANLYYYIDGAEAFHKGNSSSFKSVGISSPDTQTIIFKLNIPCSYFTHLLTMPVFMPVPMAVINTHKTSWTKVEHISGNGPFILAERKHRDRLVLKKNANYRDAATVKLHTVTALCIDEQNTAYKLFLNGKVHWLPTIPQSRIEEMKRHPDYYVYEYFGTYFYRFNVTQKPFDNPLVRQAFVLGTNRKSITNELLKGGQKPCSTYCPEVAGYAPHDGYSYDVQKARALLAKAGFPGGKGFPLVELSYNTSESHKVIAEALTQQWNRNLGIKVIAKNSEWKVFLSDMKKLKYAMARSSWIGDYSDPSTFYDCFHSRSGNNRTGWKHSEYDQLLEKSRLERKPAERNALFQRMEEILVKEECPILPIYRYVDQGLLSENVLGWYPNIRGHHPLHVLWME